MPRPRLSEPDHRTAEGQWAIYLKSLMDARGVTADQLAADAGVSRASVFNWLKGKMTPSLTKWPAIASALGLDDWRKLVPPDRFLKKLGK